MKLNKIKSYEEHSKVNEAKSTKVKLTVDEKKFFWSKIEHGKKKRAKDTETDMFTFLTGDKGGSITTEEFIKYLNCLEYSFKKQIKNVEKKFRNPHASSLQAKLPESWIGVKYSSLKAKAEKDVREEAKAKAKADAKAKK